jgi:hypothetical protein
MRNARSLKPTARAEENARSVDGFRDDDLFLRELAFSDAILHERMYVMAKV